MSDEIKPSEVPYSFIIQHPSPDLDPAGQEQNYIKLALKDPLDATAFVPVHMDYVIRFVDECFRRGAYRVEIVVGDWSVKAYKHPGND